MSLKNYYILEEEKESLPPGVHEFPFAFQLPPNLPPSFSSEKGIIRYMAAAILDRPTAANLVLKTGFSVHSVLDLNMDSNAGVSFFLSFQVFETIMVRYYLHLSKGLLFAFNYYKTEPGVFNIDKAS